MEYVWTVLIGALAVLLAFVVDSYVGVSSWMAKKPAVVSAAA